MEDDPMVSLRSVLGEHDRQRSWRGPLSGRAPRLLLAVVVIATGVVLGAGFGPAGDPPPEAAPAPAGDEARSDPRAAPAATTTSTSTTVAIRLWPAAALTVEGREVETDEGRWEVGADGDLVAVGDWDCDRLSTPAVLRPSTGEVAVFDRWAGDAPEPARPVAVIAGATEMQATPRCGEVLVRVPGGDEHVIDTRPEAA